MLNAKKLKAVLIEKGLSIEDLAKALNISKVTVYRKISGKSDFYRSEIQTIAEIIGTENATEIFFAK